MTQAYCFGTIREFQTRHFKVIVDAIEDDCCLDDLHSEPDAQKEIAEKLDSGEWTLFCARARVFLDGREVASDYLGACIYPDIADFQDHRQCAKQTRKLRRRGIKGVCGSYFSDMIRNVCTEARKTVADLQSVRVRVQS